MKIDNAEETLKNILDVMQSILYDVNDAMDNDSQIDAGGNGYNACEAGGFFKAFCEEVQDFLPEEFKFDLDSGNVEEDEESEDIEET